MTKNEVTILQLRILVAISDNQLNATAAANQLKIKQPVVSKQLSALEKIIGQPLFLRNGKRFQYETDLCRQVVVLARQILLKCDNIVQMGNQHQPISGELRVGTTHTQARYVLPTVLTKFRFDYPDVIVNIRQGAPAELVSLLNRNQLDMVICTEALEANRNFRTLVSFAWNRCLVMRPEHPLAKRKKISLQHLSQHPIVTYVKGFTGRASFDQAFHQAGLLPRVMVSAVDADVIKTYVRVGVGIGIIAEMAYEKDRDADLIMRPLNHLFPKMYVRLAYQREKFISASMQRFIQLFCCRTGAE